MTKTKPFPDFDGWHVEVNTEQNSMTFTKDVAGLPNYPNGEPRKSLSVFISGGTNTPPEIVYERGKADAYGAEMQYTTADDRGLIEERFRAATKEADGKMVLRNVEAGAPVGEYAMPRLARLGFSPDEITELLANVPKEGA